jgi:hypothetical protein
MSFRYTADHPNRLVVAIGVDEVALSDLALMGEDLIRQKLLRYALLINVASTTQCPGARELLAFIHVLRTSCRDGHPGAVAVVADQHGDLFLQLSRLIDSQGQDFRVIPNVHEARRWLMELRPHHGWEPAKRVPDGR